MTDTTIKEEKEMDKPEDRIGIALFNHVAIAKQKLTQLRCDINSRISNAWLELDKVETLLKAEYIVQGKELTDKEVEEQQAESA